MVFRLFTFLFGHRDKVKYKFKINPKLTQKEMLLIEEIVIISKKMYATISLLTDDDIALSYSNVHLINVINKPNILCSVI